MSPRVRAASEYCFVLKPGAEVTCEGAKLRGLSTLLDLGVRIPPTIAIRMAAFSELRKGIRPRNLGAEAIREAPLPKNLLQQLETLLHSHLPTCTAFAIRSSSSLEDCIGSAFAGAHLTRLGVTREEVATAISEVFASLYSSAAQCHASRIGADLSKAAMGVIIQPMIRSSASGTAFSADPSTGLDKAVVIEAVPGLGAPLLSGALQPDRWVCLKDPSLIVRRTPGMEQRWMPPDQGAVLQIRPKSDESELLCLSDREVVQISESCVSIERRFGCLVDTEWTLDEHHTLFFLQARPLQLQPQGHASRAVAADGIPPIAVGMPVTSSCGVGTVRICSGPLFPSDVGSVVVVESLDVSHVSLLSRAQCVVVARGGWTSHSTIALREHRIPAIIGAQESLAVLNEGETVTFSCNGSEGRLWRGELPIVEMQPPRRVSLDEVCAILPVTSSPLPKALAASLPLSGLGLIRMEFLISEHLRAQPDRIDASANRRVASAAPPAVEAAPSRNRDRFVEALAGHIAYLLIHSPGPVANVRLPDLLSNDYLTPEAALKPRPESNPMLGWRGASQLMDPVNSASLDIYIDAIKLASLRVNPGIRLNVLVPFCRTPEDAREMRDIARQRGLHCRLGMMVEIPSNALLAREFREVFDLFLVGPMDLTQLTYGASRDDPRLAHYCNEVEAVKRLVVCFLRGISDRPTDVYIGGWPLFQHLVEFRAAAGMARLHLVELPDRLPAVVASVAALWKSCSGAKNEE